MLYQYCIRVASSQDRSKVSPWCWYVFLFYSTILRKANRSADFYRDRRSPHNLVQDLPTTSFQVQTVRLVTDQGTDWDLGVAGDPELFRHVFRHLIYRGVACVPHLRTLN